MELFNPKNLRFDFAKYFKPVGIFSLILVSLSLFSMAYPGLNYGIDFRGGVEAQVNFFETASSQIELREILEPKLKNVSVVNFNEKDPAKGLSFSVTAQGDSKETVSTLLASTLVSKYGPQGEKSWKIERMDYVGPKAGADLRKGALLSLIYTCLLVTLYMYWRFDMRFSPGVLVCIFHDLILTTGFLVLSRAEFSTTVVAALLLLAGYSINDTVVVFDRIRELEAIPSARSKRSLVNEALNSTLSRTIMTATSTLMACVVLYFLGGPTLKDFAAALFVGIIIGTYSSAFVAAPLYYWTDAYFTKKTALAKA